MESLCFVWFDGFVVRECVCERVRVGVRVRVRGDGLRYPLFL